jgi:type I restriction enzyme, R subunit
VQYRVAPTTIPAIPEEALRKVLWVGTSSLTQTNRAFHGMLGDGISAGENPSDGTLDNRYRMQ